MDRQPSPSGGLHLTGWAGLGHQLTKGGTETANGWPGLDLDPTEAALKQLITAIGACIDESTSIIIISHAAPRDAALAESASGRGLKRRSTRRSGSGSRGLQLAVGGCTEGVTPGMHGMMMCR